MRYDAIVIGGSYAGLSAATMLARGRRTVLVLDAGLRRNRFAAHSHGVLAQDGRPGAEIVADASGQLALYPTVEQIEAEAGFVEGSNGCFVLGTKEGREHGGRKILLATGATDPLPGISGLAERWGRSVFHCPYCHGYELGGGAIGVLATGPGSAAQASTLADWGDVTFFSKDPVGADRLEILRRRNVSVDRRPLGALEGPLDGPIQVRFAGGGEARIKALFLASRQSVSPLARALGCTIEDTPHGELILTDPSKQTSVPGIYAAGDTARLPTNVTLASADGVLAGAGIHQSLIADDLEPAV